MIKKTFVWILVSIFCIVAFAHANILGNNRESIKFDKAYSKHNTTWDKQFILTDSGLKYSSGGEGRADLSIQTGNIPVGMAWRPPKGASILLEVDGTVVTAPYSMTAFIRYSIDSIHWSTWYNLDKDETSSTNTSHIYKGRISLPRIASEKYDDFEKKYYESNLQAQENTDSICRWIVKQDPSFFDHEMPFLGYAQIRLEFSASSVLIKEISVEMSWGTSGVVRLPFNNGNTADKWNFAGKSDDVH